MKIRYHHLMCIPRFKGKGYSKEFCNNMSKVKLKIENNNYELCAECDEICKACPNKINGKCKNDDKVKSYDLMVKNAIENNEALDPAKICFDCQWYYICKDI